MIGLPAALAPLGAYRQFVLYRKADKLPCNPYTYQVCDAQDSGNHTDFTAAWHAAMVRAGFGVGFVLRADDPFVVFDADKALLSDGTWSVESLALVAALPGAAIEVSMSGQGFHIWASAANVPAHGCKNLAMRFEMYHEGRYIALGGHPGATGDAAQDVTALLPGIVARWFPPGDERTQVSGSAERMPEWRGPEDDEELVRRMLAAKPSASSVFGSKATPRQLWTAELPALIAAFPPHGGSDTYDASSADMALATHLAWWTGNDEARIERLMRASGLARDKYDRADYLPRTIGGAIGMTRTCYRETLPDHAPAVTLAGPAHRPAKPRVVEGHAFCSTDDQQRIWDGCVYITQDHQIICPNGEMLDQKRWEAKHAGLVYNMDNSNDKTTDSAWEAFHYSKGVRWPKVDRASFRPDIPPQTTFDDDGLSWVNTFRPVNVLRVAGDASPFLDHLSRLFPDESDRALALDYLAALVQFQGHKFSWAMFIQGTKGNGKSLLGLCVQEAIGKIHCSTPTPRQLVAEFNAWLARSIFAYVEDIYVPHGKVELMEVLKPMITADTQAIRAMRTDHVMRRVCCNFLFFSNHKDGIKQQDDERRYASLFCAQQSKADLKRDGMDAAYFARLYGWLKRQDGYAIVAELLHTHPIPAERGLEFLRGSAPDTSSTAEAVRASAGCVDAEVEEAIASGRRGFQGGWVAANALDALLKELRLESACPRRSRKPMLERLGYVWHPGLKEGRATKPLTDGGAKCVLFIRDGHISAGLTQGVAITDAYEAAQSASVGMGVFAAAERG